MTGKTLNIFIDPRDGHEYKIVKIGSQILMAENLKFKISGGCWAFDNIENMAKTYGYLYDWETANKTTQGLTGWHLPSLDEWNTLYEYLGGDPKKVYSALVQGGSSGFNAKGGGYRKTDGTFTFLRDYDHIWSSTICEEGRAWYFNCFTSLLSNGNTSDLGSGHCNAGFSVRLFKDSNEAKEDISIEAEAEDPNMDKTGDISFLDNTVRIDEEAFTVLKNVLLDKTYDKDARKKSASIFGELGDIRAIELLKQVIDEEKSVVTIIAGCALYKLGSMDGLSYLIRLLDDDDNKIREKAAFYAGFSNIKPLSGKLVEMLNCLDQDLQRAAASGLRYLGGIEAEDAFIRILAKPIDSLVGWIEEAFISWNCKRAIPALKKAYDLATDQRQKICFANILANLGEEKLLESMLKNKDEKIVLQIAFYLSKVSNDKGFKILLASTTNSDKYIRQDAAEAFGYIHNKTAFDKLIDLLSDKDHVVRYKAALSLGRMKNKEAIPYLIRSLNDPEQLVSSNSARALGSIGDQSVLDLLLTRTDGRYISSWLTCGIIDAFLELKNSESFPFLIHCLDNRDEGVRREAANALMKLNVKSAIPSLIRKLTDPDAETRCFVAEALAVIKKSSIQKYTEKLTNNNLSIDGEPDLKIKNSPWWKFW